MVRVSLLLLSMLSFLAAISCSAGPQASSDMTQAEVLAATQRAEPPLILDVRTPREFATGHVPGATNVPLAEVASQSELLAEHRDREVIVYCERGGRAATASGVLAEAGFSNLKHLSGDMSAWRSADLPVEK